MYTPDVNLVKISDDVSLLIILSKIELFDLGYTRQVYIIFLINILPLAKAKPCDTNM